MTKASNSYDDTQVEQDLKVVEVVVCRSTLLLVDVAEESRQMVVDDHKAFVIDGVAMNLAVVGIAAVADIVAVDVEADSMGGVAAIGDVHDISKYCRVEIDRNLN